MIEVKDLVKTYSREGQKVEALKGVNITVSKGDVFGVIGLSGAGKSSLVRCISSLEKPTSGSIIVNGQDIAKLSHGELRSAQKKIGLVFQHFNLLMNSTVAGNIAFPLKIAKKDNAFIEKRVNALLEMVELTEKKHVYPAMLSGGQKQRVGIARALAAEPDILMCDEATSALDPATTKSILALLRDINQKLSITMLVITHEMHVIKELCHKVAILEDGQIIEQGSVIDLVTQPKTETAKTFFGNTALDLSNEVYQEVMAHGNHILKVTFIGENSINPYLSNIIKQFNAEIAILAGNIQQISKTIVGTLVIELRGKETDIDQVISYLRSEHVLVEILQLQNPN